MTSLQAQRLPQVGTTFGVGFSASVVVPIPLVLGTGTSGNFTASSLPTGVGVQFPGDSTHFTLTTLFNATQYQVKVVLDQALRVDCSGAANFKAIVVPFIWFDDTVDPPNGVLGGQLDPNNFLIQDSTVKNLVTLKPITLDFHTNAAFIGGGDSTTQEAYFSLNFGSTGTKYGRLGFFSYLPQYQYGTTANSLSNITVLNYMYNYKLQITGPLQDQTVSVTNTPNVAVTNTPNVAVINTANVAVTNTPSVSVSNTPNVAVSNTPSVAISGTPSVSVSNTPTVVVSGTVPISSNYPINVKVLYN